MTAFRLIGFSGLRTLRTATTESVPVDRLDSFALADGPLLLKTDTQGYDLQVLEGASGVIEQVVVLIIELSAKPIYEGMPSMMEMMGLIQQWGFETVGLFPSPELA